VANYGVRPTVDGAGEPLLEVHVLGACGFGTGDVLQVDWLEFHRGERRFGSVDELRVQIGRDRDAAAAFFGAPGPARAG
jgi:riboflavin kinase/FMN adenylyltransferase